MSHLPTTTEKFRRAWTADPGFREHILEEVARWVYKYGDFRHSGYWPLLTTPGVLDAEGVLLLHREVRDRSARGEPEWRAEFEAAFPQFRHLLPPLARGDLIHTFIFDLFQEVVKAPSAEGVRRVLDEIAAAGLHLREFPTVHACSLEYRSLVWHDDDAEPDERLNLLDIARAVGNPEITRLLTDAWGDTTSAA